jgi:hypothetical protein
MKTSTGRKAAQDFVASLGLAPPLDTSVAEIASSMSRCRARIEAREKTAQAE